MLGKTFRKGILRGTRSFSIVNPTIWSISKHPTFLAIAGCYGLGKAMYSIYTKNSNPEDIVGECIANMITRVYFSPIRKIIYKQYRRTIDLKYSIKSNLSSKLVGKNPISFETDSSMDDRLIKKMVIIYHDANRASKHLDIHIGSFSLILRVSGKPIENMIKYNYKGELTEDSKKALLNHIRTEISNNSRFPQNLDHTLSQAKETWLYNSTLSNKTKYGSGPTRQIIASEYVEFFQNQSSNKSLHMYAPLLYKHGGLYLYQIYDGKDNDTPIYIWGKLLSKEPNFEDRLHLTMIPANQFNKFQNKVDPTTVTIKKDGASSFFITNDKGTLLFSPRISKETGKRIEYTYKLPELYSIISAHNPMGIGELLFKKKAVGIPYRYLSAAEIGGILNSDRIRPRDVIPEYNIYRIDRWSGNKTTDLSFHENRLLQTLFINEANNPYIRVIDFTNPSIKNHKHEGMVGVPKGMSINDGYKIKWFQDPDDWKVEKVDFYTSEKGNIAGVIWFTSLKSGKLFKLGPGQIGSFDECMNILLNPSKYEGRVAKVHSRIGHEGRASKLLEWHDAKGYA